MDRGALHNNKDIWKQMNQRKYVSYYTLEFALIYILSSKFPEGIRLVKQD